MTFEELRGLLLDRIRSRVHNGELTERGLARLAGISQPHMHNVLKGKRLMSPEMADRLLYHLRISVLDLIDPGTLRQYLSAEDADASGYSHLPVLRGRLGPSVPWPDAVEGRDRFPIPFRATARMWQPVVARLAEDPGMSPLFGEGDFVLLDQSLRARTEIDPSALYVVKRGESGVVRRLRQTGYTLLLMTENSQETHERIAADPLSLTHFVRARATLIGREREWCRADAGDQDLLAA